MFILSQADYESLSWLEKLGYHIIESGKDFFKWLIDTIVNIFVFLYDVLITALLALFPTLDTSVQAILDVLEYVNYFVPIGYGFTLLASYYAILSSVVVYRWILKHIPTIG
jgi:hypothetical protein